jgi:hypothetical protein
MNSAGLHFSGHSAPAVSWRQGHIWNRLRAFGVVPADPHAKNHIMRRGQLANPEPSGDTWIGPVLVVLAVSLALVIAAFLLLPLVIAAFLVLPTLV